MSSQESDLELRVISTSSPPNLKYEGNWSIVQEEAKKIADILLTISDRSHSPQYKLDWRQYHTGWMNWLANAGTSMHLKDQFLQYLQSQHADTFSHVLDASNDKTGIPQIRKMLNLLPSDVRERLVSRLEIEPRSTSLSDVFNEEIGANITEFLQARYGSELMSYNSHVIADLLHAAYFGRLDEVKHSHYVTRELSNYLNSSTERIGNGVYTVKGPSLDAVVALFNAYDCHGIVEDILVGIEERRIFDQINAATKPHLNDPSLYHSTLAQTLDTVLQTIKAEKSEVTLDGSRRILQRVDEYYSRLRNFTLPEIPSELNGQAFPRFYQQESVLDVADKKRVLIADEMGTGKTAIATLASHYIAQSKDIFKTLVITTYSNKGSFAKKISQYIPGSSFTVLNGEKRREQYDTASKSDFVVVNYETLRAKDWKRQDVEEWEVDEEIVAHHDAELRAGYSRGRRSKSFQDFVLRKLPDRVRAHKQNASLENLILSYAKVKDLNHKKSVCRELEKMDFDHVVVDEIQNAKNYTSENAKAVRRVTDKAEYVTCLTGTPFVNGLSDLHIIFTSLRIYDNMIADAESRIEQLQQEGDATKTEQERKNLQQLRKYIANGEVQEVLISNPRIVRDYLRPRMIRRRIDDVLDMPPLNIENISIRLPMYQRAGYFVLESHDFKNASDQLRALQMFTLDPDLYLNRFRISGNGKTTPPDLNAEIIEGIHSEPRLKYEKLKEIVSSASMKKRPNVLVFSSHYRVGVTRELETRLKQDFPNYKVLRVDGENPEERADAISDFNETKNSIIVATMPTLKEAIELQANSSTVVCMDLPFTWAEYNQAIARVWRAYQDEAVTAYNLLISNSLDEGKWILLQHKKRLGTLFLDGAPLNKSELQILDMREPSQMAKGFLETFVKRQRNDLRKLMGSLYGKGKDTINEILGTVNRESETYADGYILNSLSNSSLHHILEAMVVYGGLDLDNPQSLDGQVFDLASGYGKFSHATGIATENLEVNPIMIERAAQFSPRANYRQGNMQDICNFYDNEEFANVIYSLAIHYASDKERGKLLYDLHKVMKKGGHLFITEPKSCIDEQGRDNLAKVLKYTGFNVVEEGTVNGKKPFYSMIAQKTGKGRLYDSELSLRSTPIEDPDEIEDEIKIMKTQHARK